MSKSKEYPAQAPRERWWVKAQVTPEMLRGMDHQKHNIWLLMLPWDAVKESASVERLSIPTKPEEHPYLESISVLIFGSAKRICPGEEEPEAISCPTCGAVQVDLDGFGVLFCPACGYCVHSSRTDDICGFCGKRVATCEACHGSGALTGMEVGFGGVDQGAECGACEGAGIIVEDVLQ